MLWKPGGAGREEGAEGGGARESRAGNSSVVFGWIPATHWHSNKQEVCLHHPGPDFLPGSPGKADCWEG